jgi:hypothetical protein
VAVSHPSAGPAPSRKPRLNLVDLLGRANVFFLYAALTFGALLFARALVPETKGLSLEASTHFGSNVRN